MTRMVRFSNNAVSKLASSITSTSTSIALTAGDGSKFPTLTGSQYFMATLVKSDGTTEVIKVTARSTDTLTVVRAAEAVAGVQTSYAFSSGDRIEHRLTAGVVASELDRLDQAAFINPLNKSANYTITASDITSLIRVNTASGNVTMTLPEISTLTEDFDCIIAKITGDANVVTITRAGSTDSINGASSYTLTGQWQGAWLTADRSTGTWTVIASGGSGVRANVDAFTGAASAGPFTLSGDPGVKENTAVYVGGVYQQKSTYTLVGTSLTLGGVVASGVSIEVLWVQPLQVGITSANQTTASDGSSGSLFTTVQGFITKLLSSAGSALIGFIQSGTGAVARWVQDKLRETVSVKDFGAVGDGVTDDTAAIQLALDAGGNLKFPKGTYKVSAALDIKGDTFLDFGGATFSYNTGANPLFTINTRTNVTINGGMFYGGTASAWLKIIGSAGPTYARQIVIDGVWLESPNTTWALDLSNYTRQVFVTNSHFECNNGVQITNKVVETHFTNNVVFRTGGSGTTYGFKISAPAGGITNPEGLLVTNCHVDFFSIGFNVTDMFGMCVSQGYYGGTSKAFEVAQTYTNVRDITVTGAVINQGSTFGPFSSGKNIHVVFTGCIFVGNTRTSLEVFGNTYDIHVADCQFNSSTGVLGVLFYDGTGTSSIKNCYFDSTYTGGVQVSGSSGAGIVVSGNHYTGTGSMMPAKGRPVRIFKNSVNSLTDRAYVMPFNRTSTTAVVKYANLATVTADVAKGQTGRFIGKINISAMTVGTGVAMLGAFSPSGISYPTGSGWDGGYLNAQVGDCVSFDIPFYATADVVGGVFLVRSEADSVTPDANSWISVVFD